MDAVCLKGDFATARWLAASFDIRASEVGLGPNQHVMWGLWDSETGGIDSYDGFDEVANPHQPHNYYRTFPRIVATGNLEMAQWLADRFAADATDARSWDNLALRRACSNGHLAMAQWLAARFGLKTADAQALGNHAFRRACSRGFLDVAQWLADHFALGAADAHAHGYQAWQSAVSNGHFAVVQWLAERFGVSAAETANALRELCLNGQFAAAQFLMDHPATELTKILYESRLGAWDDPAIWHTLASYGGRGVDGPSAVSTADVVAAFQAACGAGHLEIAQWLAGRLAFDDEQAGAAFMLACQHRRLAVARWLVRRYGLSAAAADPHLYAAGNWTVDNGGDPFSAITAAWSSHRPGTLNFGISAALEALPLDHCLYNMSIAYAACDSDHTTLALQLSTSFGVDAGASWGHAGGDHVMAKWLMAEDVDEDADLAGPVDVNAIDQVDLWGRNGRFSETQFCVPGQGVADWLRLTADEIAAARMLTGPLHVS